MLFLPQKSSKVIFVFFAANLHEFLLIIFNSYFVLICVNSWLNPYFFVFSGFKTGGLRRNDKNSVQNAIQLSKTKVAQPLSISYQHKRPIAQGKSSNFTKLTVFVFRHGFTRINTVFSAKSVKKNRNWLMVSG